MLRLLLFLASALFVYAATAQRCEAQDLRKLSSRVLISCFTSLKPCFADQWMIADELARRGSTDSIFALYWKTKDEALRAGIEKIAYRRSDEAALAFMRKVVQTGLDDGQELYVPLNYLASGYRHSPRASFAIKEAYSTLPALSCSAHVITELRSHTLSMRRFGTLR